LNHLPVAKKGPGYQEQTNKYSNKGVFLHNQPSMRILFPCSAATQPEPERERDHDRFSAEPPFCASFHRSGLAARRDGVKLFWQFRGVRWRGPDCPVFLPNARGSPQFPPVETSRAFVLPTPAPSICRVQVPKRFAPALDHGRFRHTVFPAQKESLGYLGSRASHL